MCMYARIHSCVHIVEIINILKDKNKITFTYKIILDNRYKNCGERLNRY